jgi:hypothetical protein
MMATGRWKLTEPLESVTAFFASLMLFALAAGVILALVAPKAVGGFGRGSVCVTQPGVSYSDSGWMAPAGVAARSGASVSIAGTVQVCALHPGIAERALYGLTEIPAVLAWAGVLLLLWQMISAARRTGPFTLKVAAAMRRLGWFIIAASVAAAALHAMALDQLLSTMLRAEGQLPGLIWTTLRELPVPALTGAALLTFARMFRLGAAMGDEIDGTV